MTGFDLEEFLPYQLAVLAERVSQGFADLYRERYDLSVAEWRVVAHLGQSGMVSVREIHLRAMLGKSQVSRAATKLERNGYITKKANPGRMVVWCRSPLPRKESQCLRSSRPKLKPTSEKFSLDSTAAPNSGLLSNGFWIVSNPRG